jgi:thiamine pyrophosphate-dependent acetolactate synthase large subunit-like protein
MNRLEAIRAIAASLNDEPVVVSLGHPAYDLYAAGDRPLNFYTWGSMGLTTSIALGLALARPDQRVCAIDGDGSLLMNLGSLATIGSCAPPNLFIIVMDNGQYGTTGGQGTATAGTADLEGVARALGIVNTATVQNLPELQDALQRTRNRSGPWMTVAKVDESVPTSKPPQDCVNIKHRFMAALGNCEKATAGTRL